MPKYISNLDLNKRQNKNKRKQHQYKIRMKHFFIFLSLLFVHVCFWEGSGGDFGGLMNECRCL